MISTNLKKRFYTSILLFFLLISLGYSDFVLVYSLIVLGVISILEFLNLTQKISINRIFFILFNIVFIIYIFLFCFLFLFFSSFIQLKLFIFILLISCTASDIGGFIFGKIFKGRKLTKISPKKTYSGMIGSYISSLIVSYVFFNNYFTIENLFIISLVISSVSQIGDLSISYLKRKSKMKDTGKILPGHGGLLDRFDGLILAVPFGYLFLNIL